MTEISPFKWMKYLLKGECAVRLDDYRRCVQTNEELHPAACAFLRAELSKCPTEWESRSLELLKARCKATIITQARCFEMARNRTPCLFEIEKACKVPIENFLICREKAMAEDKHAEEVVDKLLKEQSQAEEEKKKIDTVIYLANGLK